MNIPSPNDRSEFSRVYQNEMDSFEEVEIGSSQTSQWLVEMIQQNAKTFASLEAIDKKVYFDQFTQTFQPSAKGVSEVVENLKKPDSILSSIAGEKLHSILDTFYWGAQAIARNVSGDSSNTTDHALKEIKNSVVINLSSVEEFLPALEIDHLKTIQAQIETLQSRVNAASEKGGEALKKIYPDNNEIIKTIDSLRKDSLEKIEETLDQIDKELSRRVKPVDVESEKEVTKIANSALEEISPSKETFSGPEVEAANPPTMVPPIKVEEAKDEPIQEETREKEIPVAKKPLASRRTVEGKPKTKTISAVELRTLNDIELNHVKLTSKLEDLDRGTLEAMVTYTVGEWSQTQHKKKASKEFLKAKEQMEAIKFNDVSYVSIIERMKKEDLRKLTFLKRALVEYKYTKFPIGN